MSTSSYGLRVYRVVFDAGWDGGDITISGVDRLGISANETFTSPGIGGGTVNGSKVILGKVSVTNSNATGTGGILARCQFRSVLPTANAPVTSFVRASDTVTGETVTGAISDLTNGWIGGIGAPFANTYTVQYTYTLP